MTQFEVTTSPEPTHMVPQKSIFQMVKSRVPGFFFDISKYLTYNYCDIVWGFYPLEPPQNHFFEWLNLGSQFV